MKGDVRGEKRKRKEKKGGEEKRREEKIRRKFRGYNHGKTGAVG